MNKYPKNTSSGPKWIDRDAVHSATPMPALINALEQAFQQPPVTPTRHHHDLKAEPSSGEPDGTLLLMPAWRPGKRVGVKIATVFPGANALNLPAVQATYLLSDGITGQVLAILDGTMLTARRSPRASPCSPPASASRSSSSVSPSLAPYREPSLLAVSLVWRVNIAPQIRFNARFCEFPGAHTLALAIRHHLGPIAT